MTWMNSSYLEVIKHMGDGALVAFSHAVSSIVVILVYSYVKTLLLKGSGKLNTSTKIIIEEAEKNGYNMTPYKEGYDAKQILEIVDALQNNFDVSLIANPELSYQEMRDIKANALLEKRKEEAKEDDLPMLSEAEDFGLSPSYSDIDMIGIPYSMVGDICRIKLGQNYEMYSVIEFKECYYFHKEGYIALVKYK